jgi:hypothetical protein
MCSKWSSVLNSVLSKVVNIYIFLPPIFRLCTGNSYLFSNFQFLMLTCQSLTIFLGRIRFSPLNCFASWSTHKRHDQCCCVMGFIKNIIFDFPTKAENVPIIFHCTNFTNRCTMDVLRGKTDEKIKVFCLGSLRL